MLLIVAFLALAGMLCAQPKRIVSTSPSVTEILFALGAGDRVVGVSTYCHYPPEAATRTKIGSWLRPNLEMIAELRPDLVILSKKSSDRNTGSLRAMGIPVLEIEPRTVDGIYEAIERVGEAIGAQRKARSLNGSIRAQLDQVRARSAKPARRKVTFIVGRTPNVLEGIVAVGKDSYLGEVLAIAGGDNIFASAPMMYPRVPLEEVLGRNPDVIIDMGDMAQTVGVTEEHKEAIVRLWSRYRTLPAVRERRVYAVASDIFVVPGPRVVEAAREFFRLIHGEN